MKEERKKLAKQSRWYRKMHRFIAMPLVVFMFILGATGLLLTWKDELQLKPKSQKAINQQLELISLDSIQAIAINYVNLQNLPSEINRIDYRPSKGIAKIRFETHFTEIQIDCYSGAILSDKTRTADIIEMIHDGSILDYLFGNQSKPIKLLYSTISSFGLMLLAFTGFWLWLKPKQIKMKKRSN